MNKKPEDNLPEVATPFNIGVLILLWLFILLWIAPLASFAAPAPAHALTVEAVSGGTLEVRR